MCVGGGGSRVGTELWIVGVSVRGTEYRSGQGGLVG